MLGPVAGPLVLVTFALLCIAGALLLVKGHPWGRPFCLLFLGLVALQGLGASPRAMWDR